VECVAAQCPTDIHHQVIVDSDVEIETIAVAPHKPAPIVREFMIILKSEFVAKSEISTLR
jgi:hypothetical protein